MHLSLAQRCRRV